jgi:hypothetical protein
MVFLAPRSYTASYLRPFFCYAFAICATVTEKNQSHSTQPHRQDKPTMGVGGHSLYRPRGGLTPVPVRCVC